MSKLLKVLLAGQDDEGLAALRETLTSDDVEVVATAGLGPAALTWARTADPDVVVVVADESLARPVGVIQSLAQGDAPWTVVLLADRFERELVRQAMLAGARDILLRTSSPAELRHALATARQADLGRRAPEGPHAAAASGAGAIIALVGVKGGIGKTTTCVNLAVSLAHESGRSVALVDLDLPFGDIAMLLNLKPEGNVEAALADPSTLDDPDLLQRQLTPGPAGIHVLAAPLVPSGHHVDSAKIGPLLTRLAGLYDFVLVDTPGGFGELTAAALDVATHAMVVATPEATTLRRTELGLRQLAQWGYPTTKLNVLLNRATLQTGVDLSDAESILSQPIRWTVVEEPAILQAASIGQPIVLGRPNSPAASAFRSLARRLAGLPEETRRSFWSTLFSRKAPLASPQAL